MKLHTTAKRSMGKRARALLAALLILPMMMVALSSAAAADEGITLVAPELPMAAYPTLQMGDTGDAVTALQARLNALGFMTDAASGSFDMNTKNAVKSFQRAVSFAADGVATGALQARLFADDAPYMQNGRIVRPQSSVTPTTTAQARSANNTLEMPASFLTLRLASVGAEVTLLQQCLFLLPEAQGGTPGLPITGRYDYTTQAAVERYQRASNIEVNGIASAHLQYSLIKLINDQGITTDRLPTPTPSPKPTPAPTPAPTPTKTSAMDELLQPGDVGLYLPPIELDPVYCRVSVKYAGKAGVDYKLLITAGSFEDAFLFKQDGSVQYYPLMYGNREYTVKLLEERPSKDGSASKYYSVASRKLTLTTDSDTKYLASMHYVNYDAAPNARNLAKTLVASANATGTDEAVVKARVEAIYNRLVKMMKYDYENYGKLAAYYVPDIDRVLARKLGVCYDQATLLVGMLRAEGIYAKVCAGTAKGVNGYHAWAQAKVSGNRWLTIDLTMDAQMEEFNMSYTMEKPTGNYTATKAY